MGTGIMGDLPQLWKDGLHSPSYSGMVGCAPQSACQGSRTTKAKAKPHLQLTRVAGSAPATCAAQQALTIQGSCQKVRWKKNTVINSSELLAGGPSTSKWLTVVWRDCTQLEVWVFLLLPRQKKIQHPKAASKTVSFPNTPISISVWLVGRSGCVTSHSPLLSSRPCSGPQFPPALLWLSVQEEIILQVNVNYGFKLHVCRLSQQLKITKYKEVSWKLFLGTFKPVFNSQSNIPNF